MTTMLGLSLTGRRVVFVGGGAVAARRLGRFLDEGADVRIVSPELGDAMRAAVAAHGLTWVSREARRDDIADAWLVHTATGIPRVDAAVAAWCESERVFASTRPTARTAPRD